MKLLNEMGISSQKWDGGIESIPEIKGHYSGS
jgi:hypothetical protein